MGLERKIMLASLAWPTALGLLMWGLSEAGVSFPPVVIWAAIATGAVALVTFSALWCHIAWVWLRAKGLQLGPAIGIVISLAALAGFGLWGAWTWRPPKEITTVSVPSPFAGYDELPPELNPDALVSRFIVWRFGIGKPTQETPNPILLAYKNVGKAPGGKPRVFWYLSTDKGLTNEQIDAKFADVVGDVAKFKFGHRLDSQIDSGQESITTVNFPISREHLSEIRTGDRKLLLIAVLVWADHALPSQNMWRVTEYCASSYGPFESFSMCDKHNRSYVITPSKP